MFRATFGFLINDTIQVDIHRRRIIKLCMEEVRKSYSINVSVIPLKNQHMLLLGYLLTNAVDEPVHRDDILWELWDNRNMKSSSQALWLAFSGLKADLSLVGLDSDFITINKGSLYSIKPSKIQRLYVSTSC